MIISIIYLVISLILEVIMSNFFSSTLINVSMFSTIYTVVGITILYPYFNNDKKYFLLVIIFGSLFGILYTASFIFSLILFIIMGIVIKILYNVFPENIFMTNIISIIIIIIYHLISFILLGLLSSINYDFILLVDIITGSIIMTIIYTTISYYAIKFIFNRKNIKQIK